MSNTRVPRPIGHVGITVPNLEAAIEWCGEVMGFRPVDSPGDDMDATDGSHFAKILIDVFGSRLKRLRVVQLATGNGSSAWYPAFRRSAERSLASGLAAAGKPDTLNCSDRLDCYVPFI